jgi:hypothetical protein
MSHHHPSHQHQAHNPVTAAASPPSTTPIVASKPNAAKAKPCTPGADACGCQPSADHIRVRAYEISQARNGGPGNETSDWSQAEQELTAASGWKA